jgi:putative ABC transport system ATP-binding protein
MVRLTGVSKRFIKGKETISIFDHLDLAIPRGDFVAVMGPSGSGKTTLLNLVGGMEEPTCGRILVSGNDIATLNAKQRTAYRRDQVGFVFQYFNLVPTLTALENVEIIAELAGQDVARRSREALAEVGLADLADRFPAEMSGGEQQRVAIARAIVKEPPLLLCDEPTGSLDLVTGRQVLAVLRGLAREAHRTVVLVTHNTAIAEIADRVVWLHSGTVARQERVAAPVQAQDLDW